MTGAGTGTDRDKLTVSRCYKEPCNSASSRSSDDDDAENDATDDPTDADENLNVKHLKGGQAFVESVLGLNKDKNNFFSKI